MGLFAAISPSRAAWMLLAVMLALVLSPGSVAAEGESSPASAHIRWDAGLESLGHQAEEALPRVREQVARRLGWPYEGPSVQVVIVHGLERMRQEAAARVPEWAVGVAISSRSLVVIRADLLAAGYGGGLVPVLRHEWVHVAWGWRAGRERRRLPLWAEEGLAEEIGGGVSVDAGAALDLAVTFDRLIPFEELESSFPAAPRRADLAYKQSRSWVRHVAEEAGWEAIQGVLLGVLEDEEPAYPGESPFDREIRAHTRRSVGSWDASWRVLLEEQAAPWYHLLLRDFQGLLLMGLAVVGSVAAVFLFRRRRRQIADLPDWQAFP